MLGALMMNLTEPTPAELIARLDLATKVQLLTGATMFTLWPEPAIGLSELRLSDGPTGVRGLKFSGGRIVSLFPNATLLASAWSTETAHEVGRLLAQEALAQQIHVVLGPTINLHRSLLGGRLFEAYSEDPLLSGKLAAGYVRGLQELGVAACLKHLVANESETARNTMNSVVDEATLRELYLLPFQIAVEESNPWSIMAAYNDINGVTATEQHHVNTEIVKDEWGWDGVLMSDWFATKSTVASANGGLDLVMPGPDGPWGDALVQAVRDGEVSESTVDEHLRRLLVLAERVGVLGVERDYPAGLPAPDSAERKEQLTRLAAAGMTVLTNAGATLPLVGGQKIALIGRHAVETIGMGGGSAQVNAPYQVSVADGLTSRLGDAVTVVDGVEVRNRAVPARNTFVFHPETGEPGIQALVYDADGTLLEDRTERKAITLVGFDDGFAKTFAKVVLRARVQASGPVELGVIGTGDWLLETGEWSRAYAPRLTAKGFGEEMLAPPAEYTVVELDDSGLVEATVTKPVPEPGAQEGGLDAVGFYGLIARPVRRPTEQVIVEAVAAARNADVAVVVVGLTEEQETEAVDKDTLRLPGDQDALVSAVAAAAGRTVVVVNAATPVLMPWLNQVDAVLWVGLPGQEAGHAVAAALLGEIEPAGRLVTTFPVTDEAAPAWNVTPINGDIIYDEGTFIGYRGHYADRAPRPAFWFGHGLGYASWAYDDVQLDTSGDTPVVRLRVANTGDRDSRDVVQVYLEPTETDQPVRLVGWAPVAVPAGHTTEVEVTTDDRLWRRWDTEAATWARIGDGGRLLVARGLGDIRATVRL
jgi:beta-glucosidase